MVPLTIAALDTVFMRWNSTGSQIRFRVIELQGRIRLIKKSTIVRKRIS